MQILNSIQAIKKNKNVFASLGINGSIALFPIILIPFYVSKIGIGKFGLISVSFALINYLGCIVDYGWYWLGPLNIINYQKNRNKISIYISTVILSKFLLFFLTSTILIIVSIFFDFYKKYDLIFFLSTLFYFACKSQNTQWIFMGLDKLIDYFFVIFSIKLLSIIVIIFIIKEQKDYVYINFLLGISELLISAISYTLVFFVYKYNLVRVSILFFIVIGTCLFLYNSRVVIFGIIIISFLRLLSIKDKKKIIVSVIILVAFSSFVLLFSGRIYDNFNDLLNESIYTSERYTIAYCSCETASKSLLFGYDLNKIQVLLNGCYDRYYYPNLKELNFNSHCQYLDFTLKGGLLLSLSFVATIFIKLRKAIETKNILYLSITLLFSLAFLTENVLLRQYGIFAYAFFEILFLGSLFRYESHGANKIKEY